ncbi:plasmid replication protein RepC [Marinibacterium profundimaris]|uniref:Replication initiation protein RepC n=1 Tax=Marinibacterium profundimaris TaxID=1679460 RepID=A0A225NBU8_9RHOB|nr:plasmid replication protein RepC [Marinibacterium profundimaris]OWU68332.1 hypothetical protein ATO3_24430 [Marinibacterium profundimaris]
MTHLSTTPFGRRPVTAGHLNRRRLAEAPAPARDINKWAILRDLTTARQAFGLGDRALTVLSALLSFLPQPRLSKNDSTIVFPSNRKLGERANGMAESTLRRHLATLVTAGLILRHDSPNGKRYATQQSAFGFDLRPLLVRAAEISAAAEAARTAADTLRRQREVLVLSLRDATKLLAFGRDHLPQEWEPFVAELAMLKSALRRKLSLEEIARLNERAKSLLIGITEWVDHLETPVSSGNDSQTERHIQDSDHNTFESELREEKQDIGLPLELVLKACPEIEDYVPGGIHHWHELVAASHMLHPMMGISRPAWSEAQHRLGPEQAAVTLAAILQKGQSIQRPGGYLRALVGKTGFSPGPMIMALLRTGAGVSA